MKDLVAAGARYLQIEDLGAWLPLFTNNNVDYKWIAEVITRCVDGVKAKIAWHFCFGNAWAMPSAEFSRRAMKPFFRTFMTCPSNNSCWTMPTARCPISQP